MNFSLRKVVVSVGLIFGLVAQSTPPLVAGTKDVIELTTALLRGPAAYYEYELRNDTSQSAHLKKAAIHAIRLLNDCCAFKLTPIVQNGSVSISVNITPLLSTYDTIKIVKHLYDAIKDKQENFTDKDTSIIDSNTITTLRRFVLPTIEMLSALARTDMLHLNNPENPNFLAARSLAVSRYTELFCASPQNSKQRKIWGALLILNILTLISEIARLGKNALAKHEREQQVHNAFAAMVQRNEQPHRIFMGQDNECPICWNNYNDPHALGCGHVCCLHCLADLAVKGQNFICPLCRAAINSIYKIPLEPGAVAQ
jgi:hypothetical protein